MKHVITIIGELLMAPLHAAVLVTKMDRENVTTSNIETHLAPNVPACLLLSRGKSEPIAEDGWGNPDDTADYAMQRVDEVRAKFGGDRENSVLTGFSRGAIACGYIGLRNDRIAALWKGFHACQHSDGDGWNGATMTGALERATRFRGKAVFQTDNPEEKFQPVMDVMKTHVT